MIKHTKASRYSNTHKVKVMEADKGSPLNVWIEANCFYIPLYRRYLLKQGVVIGL